MAKREFFTNHLFYQESQPKYFPNDTPFMRTLTDLLFPQGFRREYTLICGKLYRLDFAQPRRKIDIEIDGYNHQSKSQQMKDALRDARLKQAGWSTIRIFYEHKDLNRRVEPGPHWKFKRSDDAREAARLSRIYAILAPLCR